MSSPAPPEALERATRFLRDLLGVGAGETAFADADRWLVMIDLAVDTLVMSVTAMVFAALGALLTIAPASRTLTVGPLAGNHPAVDRVALVMFRGAHTLARAVPEVVWALLVVFVVRPGVLAGAIALALHEAGVLGRLGGDVIDDLDRGPLQALRASGAGRFTVLAYGVLPQAVPQLITFALYRWEVVIRASVVVGFITAAGLGHELRLALSFRRWTELGLVLFASVMLVWAVEAISVLLRRLGERRLSRE